MLPLHPPFFLYSLFTSFARVFVPPPPTYFSCPLCESSSISLTTFPSCGASCLSHLFLSSLLRFVSLHSSISVLLLCYHLGRPRSFQPHLPLPLAGSLKLSPNALHSPDFHFSLFPIVLSLRPLHVHVCAPLTVFVMYSSSIRPHARVCSIRVTRRFFIFY